MKLHASDGTPYGRQVRIVLAELGLDFERDMRMSAERPLAEMAALNPTLRVPVLEDGDVTLWETPLVLEYLLETNPERDSDAVRPLLARRLYRAQHRWHDAKLLATVNTVLEASVVLRQMGMIDIGPEQSPYLKRHGQRIEACLDWLDAQATPEGFVPGVFSVQDAALICALDFGGDMGIFDWSGRTNLAALHAHFAERPSVAATRPA